MNRPPCQLLQNLSFVDNPVHRMGFVIQKVESVIVTLVGWVTGVIYVEEKSSKPAFWSIYFCFILLSKKKILYYFKLA